MNKGHDIILDDRDAKLGNKLNDWELIGIPNFIIVGKSESNQNNVTFKRRGESDKSVLSMDDLDKVYVLNLRIDSYLSVSHIVQKPC